MKDFVKNTKRSFISWKRVRISYSMKVLLLGFFVTAGFLTICRIALDWDQQLRVTHLRQQGLEIRFAKHDLTHDDEWRTFPWNQLDYPYSVRCKNASLGDGVMRDIAQLDRLVAVRLEGCAIADSDIEHLTTLSNLTFLRIRNNPVTDKTLVYIEDHFPRLSLLDVRGTNITPAGVCELGRVRPDTCVLSDFENARHY